MRDVGPRYVPALGLPALTRFYDTVLALTMRERRWRPLLRDRIAARLGSGGRVVDVGAGTGTLAIALAALRPDAQVIAVDGDSEVLRLARRKPGAERVSWRRGLAGGLDLEDGSAEAVVCRCSCTTSIRTPSVARCWTRAACSPAVGASMWRTGASRTIS